MILLEMFPLVNFRVIANEETAKVRTKSEIETVKKLIIDRERKMVKKKGDKEKERYQQGQEHRVQVKI